MPAKSKAQQQKAAGAALAAKRGKEKASALKGASRQMYESMSEGQLDELASLGRKGKPERLGDAPAKKRPVRSATMAKKTKKKSTAANGSNSTAKAKSKKAKRSKASPAKGEPRG